MWLIGKDTTGLTGRVAISETLKSALVRWYTGRGSEADHRASVSLVSTARENNKWIACDCLGEKRAPPLMSAAYLSFQETYYLRRLTSRPLHDPSCPFYLPQAPPRIRETAKDSLYTIDLPKGLFSAHQKAPEKLAQKPVDTEPDDRSRHVAIPRLGKLLWLLIERAGANVLRELPPSGARQASISAEMRYLKDAARGLEIAPGIKLSDHLYTTAIDFERRRVHARLRSAAETWPEEFAPQAFLLLEASEITSTEIVTGLGTIEIRNRIQHTGIIRAEVEPPFLVLAVVGEHSRREGYRALRAYAQPVFTGNQFVPTERDHDREVLKALQRAQYDLRRRGIRMAAKKILFDLDLPSGAARPDFLVALLDENTGEELRYALQILQSDDPHYRELRAIERERLGEAGPVISLPLEDTDPSTIVAETRRLLG
ncbi:hypothetical protein [Erythrobacter sp. CCH5-A1]|jgi:hypothetical protein|uniref:hypothetical protein n=1 Tax=Erythrobacter sp. CCH5-A1 TaxID=1768792 RepID=UPI000829FC76|nr:hypothetical protein [Erythrobacter sp. CCH5-A1]